MAPKALSGRQERQQPEDRPCQRSMSTLILSRMAQTPGQNMIEIKAVTREKAFTERPKGDVVHRLETNGVRHLSSPVLDVFSKALDQIRAQMRVPPLRPQPLPARCARPACTVRSWARMRLSCLRKRKRPSRPRSAF